MGSKYRPGAEIKSRVVSKAPSVVERGVPVENQLWKADNKSNCEELILSVKHQGILLS